MSFDTLGLSDKVLSAVTAAGYTQPTPIQAQAIPHVLERKDVLGLAQTGTGKTASFVLPMLTMLEQGRARARMPRTLILEPTRELAAQVHENFERYGVNHRLNVALLIGGVSFDEQDKKITRGADVLIATPGRLLDHFERGRLLLTGVEILVIDEADRMLDMGFIPDIERIVKLLPFTKQTLFFSATMPPEVSHLADRFLHAPVRVEVSKPSSTADTIAQRIVASGATPPEKRATLRRLIDDATDLTNAIIFCNRKRDVATVARSLEKHGYSVGALHGDMDQHARLRTLESFRDNKITLLVASDVAARGLDIPAVSHIFNFDVPTHAEDYVHRIGRTGRAGRTGVALTIATRAEGKYIQAIEKLIEKTIDKSGEAPAEESESEAADGGGRRSRRGENRGESRGESRGEKRTGKRVSRRSTSATETVSEPKEAEPVAAKPVEPKPAEEPEAVAEAAPRAPRREQRSDGGNKGRGKGRGGRNERDDEPVGFEDHVPAFLLRPVRAPKTDNIEESADAA